MGPGDEGPSAAPRPGALWRLPTPGVFGLVLVGYALTAIAGQALLSVEEAAAIPYLPAGIALAALLRVRRRQWWAVLAAVVVAEVLRGWAGGFGPGLMLALVGANLAGPLVGAITTTALVRGPLDLGERRHILAFLIGALLVGPTTAASVVTVLAGASTDFWWESWVGIAAGAGLAGIVLLAWGSAPDWRRLRPAIVVALCAVTGAAVAIALLVDTMLAVAVLVIVVTAGATWGVRAVALASSSVALTTAATLFAAPWFSSTVRPSADSLRFLVTELVAFSFVGLWVAAGRAEIERLARDAERSRLAAAGVAESEAQLRAVFSSIDEGFCVCEIVCDPTGKAVDYRFLDVNPLFEAMTGLVEAKGRLARDLVPNLEDHWVQTYARVGLGHEVLRFEQGSEAMGRWFDVFAMPLGLPRRFAIVFKDRTEQYRAERALRRAARADAFRVTLLESLRAQSDPRGVWATAARLLAEHLDVASVDYVGTLSDACVSHLRGGRALVVSDAETDGKAERPLVLAQGARSYIVAPLQQDGQTTAALVVRHDDVREWSDDEVRAVTETAELTWAAAEQSRVQEVVAARRERADVVAHVVAELLVRLEGGTDEQSQAAGLVESLVPRFADVAEITVTAREDLILASAGVPSAPGQAVSMSAMGLAVHSQLSVPVDLGRGRAQAALVVALTDPARRGYDAEDLTFLQELARRAGLVIAARRLQSDEHAIAARLQRALLPDEIRWHPNLIVEARYAAAADLMDVGGDWYDTYSWADGRIGVLVGDVVGHNLESAAAMGRLRAATAALVADLGPDPANVLDALDRCVRGPDGSDYVTAVCIVVDPLTGHLTYSTAGHPPGVVVAPDGAVRLLDGAQSLPLTGHPNGPRPGAELWLEPGSLVVLYSDGLVERPRERLSVGIDRLADHCRDMRHLPLSDLTDALVEAMRRDSVEGDDVVVTCVRFEPAVDTLSLRAPAGPAHLAGTRTRVREWLQRHDLCPRDRNAVLLAVGEACTNAAEHAYRRAPDSDDVDEADGTVSVQVSLHLSHVAIEVADNGTWRQPYRREVGGGRGTQIMQALARHFSRTSGPDGTVVALSLSLTAA